MRFLKDQNQSELSLKKKKLKKKIALIIIYSNSWWNWFWGWFSSMMDNGGGSESGESGGESATPKRAHMWLHAESARTLAFSSSTASGPTWVPPRLSPTTILRGDSRQGPSPPFHYAEPTNLSKLNAHQGEEEWANIHTVFTLAVDPVKRINSFPQQMNSDLKKKKEISRDHIKRGLL